MKTRSNEIKTPYFGTLFTEHTLSCRGVVFFQFFYLEVTTPHMAEETIAYMEKDPSVQNHPHPKAGAWRSTILLGTWLPLDLF